MTADTPREPVTEAGREWFDRAPELWQQPDVDAMHLPMKPVQIELRQGILAIEDEASRAAHQRARLADPATELRSPGSLTREAVIYGARRGFPNALRRHWEAVADYAAAEYDRLARAALAAPPAEPTVGPDVERLAAELALVDSLEQEVGGLRRENDRLRMGFAALLTDAPDEIPVRVRNIARLALAPEGGPG